MSTATFRVGLRLCDSRQSTTLLDLSFQSRSSFTRAKINHFSSLTFSKIKRSPISRIPSTSILPTRVTPNVATYKTNKYASTARTINSNRMQYTSDSVLDWNTFFRLRMSRRRYSLASSIISAFGMTGATFVVLSNQPELADEFTKLIPLDPIISLGVLTTSTMLLGWLVGPVFGNSVWKIFNRTRVAEFTLKERAFFERIKRHRVNPTGASANNPVPDYYGEKIGSVSGYRRWLKDQRAFNRKREGVYRGGI